MKKEPADKKLVAAARTLRIIVDNHFRGVPMSLEDEQKYLYHAKSLIDAAELLLRDQQPNKLTKLQLLKAFVSRLFCRHKRRYPMYSRYYCPDCERLFGWQNSR